MFFKVFSTIPKFIYTATVVNSPRGFSQKEIKTVNIKKRIKEEKEGRGGGGGGGDRIIRRKKANDF